MELTIIDTCLWIGYAIICGSFPTLIVYSIFRSVVEEKKYSRLASYRLHKKRMRALMIFFYAVFGLALVGNCLKSIWK